MYLLLLGTDTLGLVLVRLVLLPNSEPTLDSASKLGTGDAWLLLPLAMAMRLGGLVGECLVGELVNSFLLVLPRGSRSVKIEPESLLLSETLGGKKEGMCF